MGRMAPPDEREPVKLGDQVAIHFRLENGEGVVIAALSEGRSLRLRVGSGDVFPGLSAGLIGMKQGEVKAIFFSPQEGYGKKVGVERTLPKSCVPAEVCVGQMLRLRRGETCVTLWVLEDLAEGAWRVSTAHPNAGQNLAMTVKVVEHEG